MREYRFDVVRVVCMTYIITYVHLYEYIYPQGRMTCYLPACIAMAHSCLGLFTFVSGYLLGKKYCFGPQGNADVWTFYKKRILRIIPLFVLASIVLWLVDFNDADATRNGLLCISPFVDPKPRTTYYIPIILWCYLVTPLISRRELRWRVLGCISLFALLLVARFLFPSIDNRFVFNVFFYFVGVVSASCFDWKINVSYGTAIKAFVVLAFALLVAIAIKYSLIYPPSRQMAVGVIGVFVIFFVCEGISHLIYSQQGVRPNRYCCVASFVVEKVSYASMACYIFHRFFYWLAESTWTPMDTFWKWLYMACFVFPVIVVASYIIQRWYDSIVKKL